jgi:hypothetical protein
VAYVFVKDVRCNHLEARCGHCGITEVIFLGPHRLQDAVATGRLEVQIKAEAPAELRVRAERAWAAAEEEAGQDDDSTTLPEYDLTPRHERLLESFGRTLDTIPDDLLWEELRGDHDRDHPERWTD